MERDRLLIDVDDTAAQFRHKFVLIANEVLNREYVLEHCSHLWECGDALKLTKEECDKVWKVVNKAGFANTLDLMPGFGDAFEALAKTHEIAFLTKPLKTSRTWLSDRMKWVSKHFGKAMADNIIMTGAKHMVDGDWLIEDTPSMAINWKRDRLVRCSGHREVTPLIYAWPYNVESGGLQRLPDWQTIADHILCR